MFEDIIKQLFCRYAQAGLVLVVDSASFHTVCKFRELCSAVGAKIIFLPPYSPTMNFMEEHSGKVNGVYEERSTREIPKPFPSDAF